MPHETILHPIAADNSKAIGTYLAEVSALTKLRPQVRELDDPDFAFVEDGAPQTMCVMWIMEEIDSDESLIGIGVFDEDEDEDDDFSPVVSQEILTYARTAEALARNAEAAEALLAERGATGRGRSAGRGSKRKSSPAAGNKRATP